mmetsp:Transcript_6055/g.13867  ORF Transcript_6055/g.13867 Transcript_6055/m.13867 type:complete len:221 (+) Transcript_6055:274-936(+)
MALEAEVGTDLVQPARVEAQPHEAEAVPIGPHRVSDPDHLGARPAPVVRRDAGAAALAQHLEQRSVQAPGRRLHPAVAEADVRLPDPPGHEGRATRKVGPVARGPQEQAGGVPVETVDEPVACGGVGNDAAARPKLLQQPVLHGLCPRPWAPVLELPRDLIPLIDRDCPPRWLPEDAKASTACEQPRRAAGHGLQVERARGLKVGQIGGPSTVQRLAMLL